MEPFRVLFKENGQENLLVPAQEKRGVLREGSRGLQIMSNGELSQAKRKAENMSKVGGMAAVGDNQENSAPKMSTKVQSDALCNQKTTFKGKEKVSVKADDNQCKECFYEEVRGNCSIYYVPIKTGA